MSNSVIIESKGLIWTTCLPDIPEGKPYYIAIKMYLGDKVRKLYADPSAAPHLYATTPDDLTGTPEKRRKIIEVVPDKCNTLVASHEPTNGHIYHHKIRLMDTGDMLYLFPDLKRAQEPALRAVYQTKKKRFANSWIAIALDSRYSKKGSEAIICFSRLGNEFWSRDTGCVHQVESLQFSVPQRLGWASLGRMLMRLGCAG